MEIETVVIVFWQGAETKITSIVGTIHPWELKNRRATSMTIRDFFEGCGITVEEAMKLFPEDIIPNGDASNGLNWFMSMRQLRLPKTQNGLQKLADLINMPIAAYEFVVGEDNQPRQLFTVAPS